MHNGTAVNVLADTFLGKLVWGFFLSWLQSAFALMIAHALSHTRTHTPKHTQSYNDKHHSKMKDCLT